MLSMGLLEWLLSQFVPQDRATAILGDLLEAAETRGRVWFWVSAVRVLARLAWREPVAWAAGYGTVALLYSIGTVGDLAANAIGNNVPEPVGVIPALAMSVVGTLALPLWFMVPYGVLRFGVHDEMSRVSLPVCAVAGLGFWLCHPQATGIRSAALEQMLINGCAVVALALIVAALVLRQWRSIVALTAAGSIAVGITIGLMNVLLSLAFHYEWSYNVRWVAVRVGGALAFWVAAVAYSTMHGLLRSSPKKLLLVACAGTVLGIALGNVPDPPPGFGQGDPHLTASNMQRKFRPTM